MIGSVFGLLSRARMIFVSKTGRGGLTTIIFPSFQAVSQDEGEFWGRLNTVPSGKGNISGFFGL